ncbi:MAG: TonB-dependent receptor [Leptolyngbyaceae cyanobacterium RM2_2_4]|nr:TonB-dependent receptor [Leptolyngbyaceae cyanobacterium SM1_4_3]NJO50140.1 TonB-dependent receptor [Leptolyngbyaceae cyanobacterium RM2_2_4]
MLVFQGICRMRLWLRLALSGGLICALGLPVGAEETGRRAWEGGHEPSRASNESRENQIPELAQAPVVSITGIQVNPTESGLEIILTTANGDSITSSLTVVGNAQVADITNAVLELPDAEEFQAANPVEGIALVTVSTLPNNRVRVAITGSDAPPATNIRTDAGGLVLSVEAIAATDEMSVEGAIANDAIQVVVTAERTPEDVQEVPLSITVLTEQQLEDANVSSLEGIADNTPNFTFFPSGANRTAPFYSLRGVTNFNAFSRDAVGFFVDDVPYDFAGFIDQDLVDLERVEVLRGPQNTLYGRSSLGGAINIITRRPTNEFEASTALSYGSYDAFDAQASISGPIVEDQLFYRLSGNYGRQDGFVENTLLDTNVDGGSGGTGRAQLLWTPSDEWEILLNASFADYREGAEPFVLQSSDDPFETELNFDGFNDLVTNAQSLRVAYNTPQIRVTSITAHRFSSQEGAFDQDATAADLEINAPDFSSRVFTQELRVQSPEASDRFQWIVGGYFETSTFNNDRAFITGLDTPATSPLPAGENLGNGVTDSRTLATFGQVSYGVTEALTLTAGLRYENTQNTTDFERIFTSRDGTLVLPLLELNDLEANGSELLPRFAIDYRFTPNLMAYGSLTRGYRPPGASFDPISADTAVFDAETSWNYELGLKSSWLGDRLIVNLAGFYNDVSNFQYPSIQAGSVVVSNADIRIIGGELEVIARPVSGLELIAGLGLLSAEFRNGTDAFTGIPLEGNRTPFTPSLTYNLAAQYRSDIGILGRVELIGFGNTFFDDLNTVEQGSFALVNARVGYEFDSYGIYLFANNLFDNEYITQAFNLGGGIAAIYGAPRTAGLQVRARF